MRVTGPDRRFRPVPRTGDLDQQTELGAVYVGSLVRTQLGLGLAFVAVLVLTVGALPLLFRLAPGLADVDVAGVPLAWLLLGVGVYPWVVLLGWLYVRRAERNEHHFAEMMGDLER